MSINGYVHHERAKFSRWLRNAGIRFAVVHRSSELAGAPSHLVLDPPPLHQASPGVAVLFKHPDRLPTDAQSQSLDDMASKGWKTILAFSFNDAVREIEALGYKGKEL